MTKRDPFLLLNEQSAWGIPLQWQGQLTQPPPLLAGVTAGAELQLQPLPGPCRPLVDPTGSFGGFARPTALALDQAGNVYVLDRESQRIAWFDPCDCALRPLPAVGGRGTAPRRFMDATAIAISARNDLLVADGGNRRVQVFALKGTPLRAIWGPFRVVDTDGTWSVEPVSRQSDGLWPDGTWEPWDIGVGTDGRCYVTDHANGLIHLFDAAGRWCASFDGRDDAGQPLIQPTHLAVDGHGRIYVAQAGEAEVVVLDDNGRFLRRISRPEEVEPDFSPRALAVDEAGILYLCGRSRWYMIPGGAGDAARCYAVRGRGCALALDDTGQVYLIADPDGTILQYQPHNEYVMDGYALLGPLDSEIYRCPWHRLALAGIIPQGTYVQVETFTSDTPRTAFEVDSLPDHRWGTSQTWSKETTGGSWDCLVKDSPPGRFLWLRLSLWGDREQTPAIREIRAHFPRRSSLRHLPALFREDPVSADFLDRYLSLFDHFWTQLHTRLDGMAAYFDPDAVPAEQAQPGGLDFLSWLASWLDLALDRHWPEEKRRRLLKHAPQLFALRGTPEGVKLHVSLFTGTPLQLLEHFQLRRWLFLNQMRLGAQSALWGADAVDRLQLGVHAAVGEFQLVDYGDPVGDPFYTHAHRFTLYVPLPAATDSERQTIDRIVEMAKPAHTEGTVVVVEPKMRIGCQSLVGVDTVIGRYPSGVVAGEATLGRTVLSPSPGETEPPTLTVGKRARIGSSTRLD